MEELESRPWLLREPGSGTRTLCEEFLASRGIEPSVLTLGSNGAIKQAARAGLGIALQSRAAVELELKLGLLDTITPRGGLPERRWHVVRSAIGPVREDVEAFMASAPPRRPGTRWLPPELVDCQRALHACLAMAGHRAVVGVRAGLQRDVEALRPAVEEGVFPRTLFDELLTTTSCEMAESLVKSTVTLPAFAVSWSVSNRSWSPLGASLTVLGRVRRGLLLRAFAGACSPAAAS